MKREILFKGKRLNNGEWVYGYAMPHDKDLATIFNQNPGDGTLQGFEVDPATIGQFTGLLDKNGKKIFEGDILCSENGYASPIGWDSHNAAFATGDDANGEYVYTINQSLASTKEVTTSIYDDLEVCENCEKQGCGLSDDWHITDDGVWLCSECWEALKDDMLEETRKAREEEEEFERQLTNKA